MSFENGHARLYELKGMNVMATFLDSLLVTHFLSPPFLEPSPSSYSFRVLIYAWTCVVCLELSQIYKTLSWPAGAKPHYWWFIPKTQKQNAISYSLIVTIPFLPLLSLILVPFLLIPSTD